MVRVGRPKAESPKNETFKIRLDEKMKIALENYSIKHGISKTAIVRKGIQMVLDSDK